MPLFHLQKKPNGRLKAIFLSLLCALALSACKDDAGGDKPASQVAARVNDSEISIHQVNFLLQRAQGVAPEKTEEVKRQILDGLVDQELAVQQALEAKLDRDPKIMQTLEAARREILARAYMEQTVAAKGKPSPEEVRTYYKEHPELFASRRIYRLQELSFPATPETVAAVREQIAKARRGEELLNGLREKGVKVAGGVMVKPAEKISLDLLPRLAEMKEGQSAMFENGNHASIVTLLGTTLEPMSEETAKPLIEEYLNRRQSNQLAKEALHQLREKAKIEYVGDFGKEAEAARLARQAEEARQEQETRAAREAARLAQAQAAAKQAEAMQKAREAARAERERQSAKLEAPSDNTISKGISGLK